MPSVLPSCYDFEAPLGDRAALEQRLAVHLYGTYRVAHAFLPFLHADRIGTRSR